MKNICNLFDIKRYKDFHVQVVDSDEITATCKNLIMTFRRRVNGWKVRLHVSATVKIDQGKGEFSHSANMFDSEVSERSIEFWEALVNLAFDQRDNNFKLVYRAVDAVLDLPVKGD